MMLEDLKVKKEVGSPREKCICNCQNERAKYNWICVSVSQHLGSRLNWSIYMFFVAFKEDMMDYIANRFHLNPFHYWQKMFISPLNPSRLTSESPNRQLCNLKWQPLNSDGNLFPFSSSPSFSNYKNSLILMFAIKSWICPDSCHFIAKGYGNEHP